MGEKKNNSIKEIWDIIEGSEKVLLTLHPFPDGDSMGSCLALKRVLENKGKNVDLVSKHPVDDNFHKFDFTREIDFSRSIEEVDDSEYGLTIFLDHGSFGNYFYENKTIRNYWHKNNVINIDHHETNPFFGGLNYVDSSAVSTCTVLLDKFRELGVDIDPDVAHRLLLGICTDSRFFSYGNFEKIFSDVSYLCGKGGDYKEILGKIIESVPYKMKKLEGEILKNMKIKEINGKKVAGSFISKEFVYRQGLSMAEIRRGIDFIRNTEGILVYFTLSEVEKGLKGSLRCKESEGDVNVFDVAKEFGGGGHLHAAAFLIEDYESMEKSVERVFDTISKHL